MAQKITIGLSVLSGISYGGLTYFRNLIPRLAEADKANEYHIFVAAQSEFIGLVRQANFHFHVCPLSARSALARFFWEQAVLPFRLKALKVDVMFTAKNITILFSPSKTIISLRNMEPLCFNAYRNDWRLDIFSWMRRSLTQISIAKATHIIAVSLAVSEHLQSRFSRARGKITVVYNGNPVAGRVRQECDAPAKNRQPYFLCASKFVAYANQMTLLKGYARVFAKDPSIPELWFAGGVLDKKYFGAIATFVKNNGLSQKVKFLGLVSHERLMELYKNAYAFLFSSTLEACPQTLIEAMAWGVPILSSSFPPMPELCENAAIYFDPLDAGDIAQKIELLLSDRSLREASSSKGLERAAMFTWEKTARELVGVFEKVAS